MSRDSFLKKQEPKFSGFDFLRAFFSMIVVALHANLFNVMSGKGVLSSLTDILSMNVGYVAVPVFIQVSLFLFYLKSYKSGPQYILKNRLPKLVVLYLFWVSLKLLFDALFRDFEAIRLGTSSLSGFLVFVVGAGETIFYFFSFLFFLTIITELLVFLSRRTGKTSATIRTVLLFISCILVFMFSMVDIYKKQIFFTQIINYLNFLPYVFIASIVGREFAEGKLSKQTSLVSLKMRVLVFLAIFFIILEYAFLAKIAVFPDRSGVFLNYSRLSLVFTTWFLLYFSLLSTRKIPSIVELVSKCSLGIYGFHTLFTDHLDSLNYLSEIVPGLGVLSIFLIAFTGSIALTLVFRKITWLKPFV